MVEGITWPHVITEAASREVAPLVPISKCYCCGFCHGLVPFLQHAGYARYAPTSLVNTHPDQLGWAGRARFVEERESVLPILPLYYYNIYRYVCQGLPSFR